ncbi:hypothetical protein RND71_026471 [Anisodus tanguticus]|uniref:Uncharacterized protein n=1 Tax=Anisodus tanguticus TaxID=243964 RepID=A0AAE1V3U0_9SOLA|nr:hypothetical protein RND71_026471 [Anisodus tanguticus]
MHGGDEVGDHVLALLGCSYNEENIEEYLDDMGDNRIEEFIDSVLLEDEIEIECLDDRGDNGVKEFIDSVLQDDEIATGEENFIECMEGDEVGDHVLALLGYFYNEENIEECLDDQGDNGVEEFIDSVLQDDEIEIVEEFIDSVLQDDEIATGEENFIECMEGDEVGDHVLALLGYFYNEENIEECLDDRGIMESKNLSIPFYKMMK